MQENPPLHVVAAIIVADSKVLACRRASHKAAAGLWEFPGGKVDPGEDAHTALIREIKEELGLDCETIHTFDVSDTLVGTQIIRLETILCKIEAIPSLSSTDHDDFVWLSQNDISTLDWAKPDLPAVAKLALRGGFSDLLV